MSDGIVSKLGVLSGRLNGVEQEENLVQKNSGGKQE